MMINYRWCVLLCFLISCILLNDSLYADNETIHISGRIIDKETGKGLSGANVELLHKKIGTTTNENAEFFLKCELTLADTLQVSFMGYKTITRQLSSNDISQVLVIKMEPVILDMQEVSIYGDRLDRESASFALDPSARRIKSGDIKKVPAIGSPDVFRSIQHVPGVSFTNEASSQFHVRGGNLDQNLVLLDGAVVYYPFHVFGLSSMFNVDYIKDLYFSLGGYSAQYGDRLSSVLAMQSRKPQNNFPHRINLNIIGLDVTTGGQFAHFGWVYSGKTSFLKLPNNVTYFEFPYEYYDHTLKLEYMPSKNHSLEVMLLTTKDKFNIEDKWKRQLASSIDQDKSPYLLIDRDVLEWDNRVLSTRWKGRFSDRINLEMQFYQSDYSNFASQKKGLDFQDHIDDKFRESMELVITDVNQENDSTGSVVSNHFSDETFKVFMNYSPSNHLNSRVGFQRSNYRTNYGWDGLYQFQEEEFVLYYDYASAGRFVYLEEFSNQSAFSELEFNVASNLKARSGIRLSKWNNSSKLFLEPRVNLRYERKNFSMNLAYGKYTQGLTTILEEGLIGFLELYFPAVENDRIETAEHSISSIKYQLFNTLDLSLSGYYKKFDNLLKATGPGPTLGQTTGKAYGMEIEMNARIGGTHFRGAYTWAHSNRTHKEITYDSNFDIRHRVQLYAEKELGNGFNVSLYWEFHTGQPYDPKVYRALLSDYEIRLPLENGLHEWYDSYEIDVVRGGVRYPPYHRLDFNIMRTIKTKKFTLAPYLSIRNLYNRQNPLFYKNIEFQMEHDGDDFVNPHIERDAFTIGILPTVGVRIGF
ncbi:TonB-dependent receptor plug domain-containing protein [candidate division KSB1 bacterium]|nr:TonB-dependent receptor plug domain-containing protein [candidate division KSB1 bacterium]